YGACPVCDGLGSHLEVDPDLVVPDPERSLADGAIAPWSGGQSADYFQQLLSGLAADMEFDLRTPWQDLPAKVRKAVLGGAATKVRVRYRNRFGRVRTYDARFEGGMAFLKRRLDQTASESQKERYQGYMREVPGPSRRGPRLMPQILAVTMPGPGGRAGSIADISRLSVVDCARFLDGLVLDERQAMIAGRVLKEIQARMGFLLDVGLDYLSLDRVAGSLSG